MKNKKGAGLIPDTVIGWFIAITVFLVVLFFIMGLSGNLNSLLDKLFSIFGTK